MLFERRCFRSLEQERVFVVDSSSTSGQAAALACGCSCGANVLVGELNSLHVLAPWLKLNTDHHTCEQLSTGSRQCLRQSPRPPGGVRHPPGPALYIPLKSLLEWDSEGEPERDTETPTGVGQGKIGPALLHPY